MGWLRKPWIHRRLATKRAGDESKNPLPDAFAPGGGQRDAETSGQPDRTSRTTYGYSVRSRVGPAHQADLSAHAVPSRLREQVRGTGRPAHAGRCGISGAIPWKVPDGVLNLRDTSLLVAVDPYGDTVFNRFQIEQQLSTEIAYLRQHLTNDTEVAMLDELDRLADLATEPVHRYLWFVGD